MLNKFYLKEIYGNEDSVHDYLKNIAWYHQDINRFYITKIPLRFNMLYCVTGDRNTRLSSLGTETACFKFFMKLNIKTIMHFCGFKVKLNFNDFNINQHCYGEYYHPAFSTNKVDVNKDFK